MRTALLSAVSHDLRTPLSSAMAAVKSLANPDITWTGDERAELVATASESLERLHRLVANLLDMSRLQAGVLGVYSEPLALEEIIPASWMISGRRAAGSASACPMTCPRYSPTRPCSSGSWPTSPSTRCATVPPASTCY